MKKLGNLKLKKFHEMSVSEMKNVVGGYDEGYDTGDKPPYYGVARPCNPQVCFGSCSVQVQIPGQYGVVMDGTCQISYALWPYYTGCACIV